MLSVFVSYLFIGVCLYWFYLIYEDLDKQINFLVAYRNKKNLSSNV